MLTKQQKKKIQKRLKDAGANQKIVFDYINQNPDVGFDVVSLMVNELIADIESKKPQSIGLNDSPAPYHVFGSKLISRNAIDDMDSIMRLPYVKYGALMPDSHRVMESRSIPLALAVGM